MDTRERKPNPSSAKPGERAVEGDAPAHPDRFGGVADKAPAEQPKGAGAASEAQQGDRAQEASDRDDYVPEGK